MSKDQALVCEGCGREQASQHCPFCGGIPFCDECFIIHNKQLHKAQDIAIIMSMSFVPPLPGGIQVSELPVKSNKRRFGSSKPLTQLKTAPKKEAEWIKKNLGN